MATSSYFTEILRNTDPDDLTERLEKMDASQSVSAEFPTQVMSENSGSACVSPEVVSEEIVTPSTPVTTGKLL